MNQGMHDGFKAFVEGIESSFLAAFSDHFGRDARNTEHENLLKRQKRRLTDDFSRQKCKGFPAGEVLKAASKYLAETLLYSHGLGSQGESARLTPNTAKAIIKAAYKQSGEDDAQLDDLIEQLNSKRPTVMAEAAKQMASIKEDKCQEEAQQRQTELLQSFSRQQTGTTTRVICSINSFASQPLLSKSAVLGITGCATTQALGSAATGMHTVALAHCQDSGSRGCSKHLKFSTQRVHQQGQATIIRWLAVFS